MKQVILPLPTDDKVIEYPRLSGIIPNKPLGIKTAENENKYLVVRDPYQSSIDVESTYCYALVPINRLNDSYDTTNRHATHLLLEELLHIELTNDSEVFLFECWSEFYEWCLE